MAGGALLSAGLAKFYPGKMTVNMLFTRLIAATGCLIFSYDLGYDIGISGEVPSMDSLTLLLLSLYLAALVASSFASWMTRKWGRKITMLSGGVVFLAVGVGTGFTIQSERNPDAPTGGGCRSQAKGSNCGHRIVRSNTPPLLRRQPTCLCSPSNHPGSFRCSQHRSAAVSERPRRQPIDDREIVKRALSPPLRRCPSRHHRRWNFRSMPSRLCNMSMD